MLDAQGDALAPTSQSLIARAPSKDGMRRIATSVVIAVGVLAADQFTKWLAHTYLTRAADQSVSIVGDFVRLTYVANRGAAFGILQDRTIFFVLIGVAVIAVIIASYRYFKVTGWLLNVALGLQLGGAIGNLIDRVRTGYVVDFIDVGIRSVYSWPVFNVADSAIVVGVGILAFHMMRTPKPKANES
jgi:signal peptidase II